VPSRCQSQSDISRPRIKREYLNHSTPPSSLVLVFSSPAILSLIFARILYAVNWFNISSIFYLIATDFKQDISMLGLVTAGFLIGIGIFQVPAGMLAAKYGPRKLAISGILISSTGALLCALSTELLQMIALRFLVGVGMAFFFGPSVILISKYLGKGSEGLGIGLLNSAQALGAIIGIFGWVVVAQLSSWRISLIFSGTLGILTALFLVFALAREKKRRELSDNKGEEEEKQEYPKPSYTATIRISDLKQTLLNRSLIMWGLALLGIQVGWNLISTFTVFYLKDNLHIYPIIAGLIGSLALVSVLVFSPIFGRIYGKMKASKELFVICGVGLSISVSLIALNTLYATIISITLAGIFAAGGFVVPYARAKEINEKFQPMYATLAVSYVNGVSLFGAFWVPFLFSSIVKRLGGYSVAWLIGSVITLVLVLLILRQKS
jgi:MFS family permease